MPPSLNLPHPVTVAFSPIRRSSEPGKHIGTIWGVYFTGASNRTMAKSYSYVKKLYLGCTIFRATARSTNGYGSWSDEKSYSPTLIRICDVSKLWLFYKVINFSNIKIIIIFFTHSSTQWPAVAIQFSFNKAPPHRCVLENPKNDVLRTDTYIIYNVMVISDIIVSKYKWYGHYCLPAKANCQTQSFSRQQCGLRAWGAKEPNHKLRKTKSYKY